MTTITFLRSYPYSGNRPYADVKLSPSHPSAPSHYCLVDTGADYLMLPETAGIQVGLLPGPHVVTSASGVGGSVSCLLVSGVDVQIEGRIVHNVDVLFDTTNRFMLAGRGLVLMAYDMGFQTSLWLSA